MSNLTAANAAKLENALDKVWRDSMTGVPFTLRKRFERGAYAYRTRHVQAGKRDTYGLILANEIDGTVDYMTPVCSATKTVFDYAENLPMLIVDEDKLTVTEA